MTIDGLKSGIAVYGEVVRSEAEYGTYGCQLMIEGCWTRNAEYTVFLMASPELEMPVTLPCIVNGVPICELGQEWSRILSERVEGETIQRQENELGYFSQVFKTNAGETLTYVTIETVETNTTLTKRPTHSVGKPEKNIAHNFQFHLSQMERTVTLRNKGRLEK